VASTALRDRLVSIIEPMLEGQGYELVELECTAGRGQGVVRVFIDRPEGIGIEDCERVSRDVSALLDVEDPMPSAYSLEVSSPGFDRVLRKPAHFERFVGARVWVELEAPRDGRRRYTGELKATGAAGVTLEVDGQPVEIAFSEIGRARIAP
jgi:ribosome maturation factor RimP